MLYKLYKKIYMYIKNYNKNIKIKTPYISRDVKLGKNVIVGENCRISYGCTIGDNTYINYNSVIDAKVKIGKFCSIAPNVYIAPGNHTYSYLTTHPMLYDKFWQKKLNIHTYHHIQEQRKETIIGNDVWIGVNATILEGIKVGNGAIIGANAVVTKDVEDYAIVAGNPAKRIKYRFEKEEIQKLKELDSWWDKNIAKMNIEKMYDIKEYIQQNERNKNDKEVKKND